MTRRFQCLLTRGNLAAIFTLVICHSAASIEVVSLGGTASIETRLFQHSPKFDQQADITLSPSISLEPEVSFEWNDGSDQFNFEPFVRWDNVNGERSHYDLREANWVHIAENYDVLLGVSKVFWGVTESIHLVDIVNQTDTLEDIRGESKFGQPMLNINYLSDWGNISVFALPYFRERNFPDQDERLRGRLSVSSKAIYGPSSNSPRQVSYALRWTQTYGSLDVGLGYFYGTSREPRLQLSADYSSLIPYYDDIEQASVELQYTHHATLWKLESISRSGHGKRFTGVVAGFEHTYYGALFKQGDLGLIAEYLYDNRNQLDAPASNFDNDLFLGLRYTHNDEQDSTILAGFFDDQETHSRLFIVEAERRISESWKLTVEGAWFSHINENDWFADFEQDDHIAIQLSRHF